MGGGGAGRRWLGLVEDGGKTRGVNGADGSREAWEAEKDVEWISKRRSGVGEERTHQS